MNDYGRVAVLMGGQAAERAISLKSGQAVLDALLANGVDAHAVDTDSEGLNQLQQGQYDRAFIVLHGRGGEDGVIQGFLETHGIPYTGSGVMASAIGMDKYRSKLLWSGANLPTPAYLIARSKSDLAKAEDVGFPMMVKPILEGSSIGMSRVENAEQLLDAWILANQYGTTVLLEKWVAGNEYTCAIVDDQTMPLIELKTPNVFYDYAAKYQDDTTEYICPCDLSLTDQKMIQTLSKQAFDIVGARGWGRVDLMIDAEGKPWLIEINTVPGMTDHSLVPMAAKEAGMSFSQLVMKILSLAGGKS